MQSASSVEACPVAFTVPPEEEPVTIKEAQAALRWKGYSEYIAGGVDDRRSQSDAHVFWEEESFPDLRNPKLKSTVRVVLCGQQGAGKSSLYNRLYNKEKGKSSTVSVSSGTCTRRNVVSTCSAPFEHVEIVDTPGSGSEVANIAYDDSFQLRQAFVEQPVHLIAMVAALDNNPRVASLIDKLRHMDRIMNCSTFKEDHAGILTPPGSADRTRVTLVLTHRDDFKLLPEAEWEEYVQTVRETYDWIGTVVMIDPSVPIKNLLGAIIAPALCMAARRYVIPMPEFCCRFPISRYLNAAEASKIARMQIAFNQGVLCALAKLKEVVDDRAKEGYSGDSGYVDAVGPSFDSVLRFLDDLYQAKTLEALSAIENVPVDDLWAGTDKEVNDSRVEKWNAIKANFGDMYEKGKAALSEQFPNLEINAIYKKCNYCGIVYVKPYGCDFGTRCGVTSGGKDSLPWYYEYEEKSSGLPQFDIVRGNGRMGRFESWMYHLRRSFSDMVCSKRLLRNCYGAMDMDLMYESGPVAEHPLGKGCGKPIQWKSMLPLTMAELKNHNLVPEGKNYAVTLAKKAALMSAKMSLKDKMNDVCKELGTGEGQTLMKQVDLAAEEMGVEEELKGEKINAKVQFLYDKLFEKSE